ncbi:MAG: capsular polysaccharide synthesis protein [Clostridia bacterium]|nr:capsular polysaccharide synthesis protein [Clostridia bacterium]
MKIFLKWIKEFGFLFTIKYYTCTILEKLSRGKLSLKNNIIKKYIKKHYKDMIVDNVVSQEYNIYEGKIWVFWWTGIETAPDIVKRCIEKIKKSSNDKVVILDKNNIKNYIEIPPHIYDKIEKGYITITHFSDILRMCLLSQYGGLWLDSTIYYTGGNIKEYLEREFYTIKHLNGNSRYVSKNRWTGYFLSCKKNNLLVVNVRNILFEYWKKHDTLIEYFLIDFLIDLVYSNNYTVKCMIDNLEPNNENNEKLVALLNEPYKEEILKKLINNTNVFKLTWKQEFKLENEGKKTFYNYIINGG